MEGLYLLKALLKGILRQRLQTALIIVGLMLGVSIAVGIDLANDSAITSFKRTMAFVSGKATHTITSPSGILDESLYFKLASDSPHLLNPILSSPVMIGRTHIPVILRGIDPFTALEFGSFGNALKNLDKRCLISFLTVKHGAFLSRSLIRKLGLKEASLPVEINLFSQGEGRTIKVLGIVNLKGEEAILMDISNAQDLLREKGGLSFIGVILKDDKELKRLSNMLPPGVVIRDRHEDQEIRSSIVNAFRTNLQALSLLSLLVCVFLIYNVGVSSILHNRKEIATLRALGAYRREILIGYLVCFLLLGLIGSALGLLLGILMAKNTLGYVSSTISQLYFFLRVDRVHVTGLVLAKGFIAGLLSTLLGILSPLLEAIHIPPAMAFREITLEERVIKNAKVLLLIGIVILFLSALAVQFTGRSPLPGFFSAFLLVLSLVFFSPLLLLTFSRALLILPWSKVGLIGLWVKTTCKEMSRRPTRMGIASAAFVIALSMVVSLDIMVGSFEKSLKEWIDTTIKGDIYIFPIGGVRDYMMVSPKAVKLAYGLTDQFDVDLFRMRKIHYGKGQVVLSSGIVPIFSQYSQFRFFSSLDDPIKRIEEGGVFVSENFQRLHGIKVGDKLELKTAKGPVSFSVVAIIRDYTSDLGNIIMTRKIYTRYWKDPGVNAIILFHKDGPLSEKDFSRVKKALSNYLLEVKSNQKNRKQILQTFHQAFRITTAMKIMAIVISFLGITVALMASIFEHSREIFTLRAIGVSRGEASLFTLIESILIGGFSGLLSLAWGFGLSVILIYVINLRCLGWRIDLFFPPLLPLQIMLIAWGASILATLFPFWGLYRQKGLIRR